MDVNNKCVSELKFVIVLELSLSLYVELILW